MSRRLLAIGVPAILVGYTTYTLRRLYVEYPLLPLRSYHRAPSVVPLLSQRLEQQFGPFDVVYATIPLSDHLLLEVNQRGALDTLLQAFWATWTLRLEGLVARLVSYEAPSPLLPPSSTSTPGDHPKAFADGNTPPASSASNGDRPKAFAGGLFSVWNYSPNSVVTQWRASPSFGGVQEISAVILPSTMTSPDTTSSPQSKATAGSAERGQVLEISFACAQYGFSEDTPFIGKIGTAFHRLYMRFLIDQATSKLLRSA